MVVYEVSGHNPSRLPAVAGADRVDKVNQINELWLLKDAAGDIGHPALVPPPQRPLPHRS